MSDLQMIVFDSTVVDSKKFLEGLEATGFAAARLGDARTCGQQPNTKNSRVFSENGETVLKKNACEILRGFGFDLRSSSSLRLGILLGNSDCTSEIGAEGRCVLVFS